MIFAEIDADVQWMGESSIRDHVQSIRTTTVHDFDALAPHIPAWDRLTWDAPQNVWTLLPGWVDAFLRHRLKPNESWFCSFAYMGSRLVGVLPVIVAPHPIMGRRWPLLRSVCDDIALSPDCAAEAFKSLLSEIDREVPNHLGLNFKVIRHNSPVWLALKEGASGYTVHKGPCYQYWFLDVRGDLNTYWASLGKMRQNLRKTRRRLEKRSAVSVEIRKGASAGEDFLTEFLNLEASGWKGRMGTAILNNSEQVAFYKTLVRNFASQGRLEWHGIRAEGRLIAGQIGIRCGQTLILPKYSYDEAFAECSPGHLLTEEVIKEAFSRRDLARVSTMSKAPQCRLWHMAPDDYSDLYLVRRSLLALLFHWPNVAARTAFLYARSRTPPAMMQSYMQLKRREYRKFLRSIFRAA